MALRRIARTVPALLVAALLVGVAATAAPRPLITQADSGKTFRLATRGTATLHLSGRWGWTQPRASPKRIQLTPIEYFADPGFSAWTVAAQGSGTFTIASTGKPGCTSCGLTLRHFQVTIVVRS
jgi:hypothetical protein